MFVSCVLCFASSRHPQSIDLDVFLSFFLVSYIKKKRCRSVKNQKHRGGNAEIFVAVVLYRRAADRGFVGILVALFLQQTQGCVGANTGLGELCSSNFSCGVWASTIYKCKGQRGRNHQHRIMPVFCIGESVRIEPRSLQQNLVAANLNIGEYEELLLRHGVVEQVLDGGMYFVMFMARNNTSQNVGHNINEAGLRVVWQVGQLVRANVRFYNATQLQMLQSVDVRVHNLYPSGNFDVTGIVQRDVGSGRYSVMMRLPSNNDNVQAHELHIDSDALHPVWNIFFFKFKSFY